jgi:hypothetical protein
MKSENWHEYCCSLKVISPYRTLSVSVNTLKNPIPRGDDATLLQVHEYEVLQSNYHQWFI